eukprot:3979625-Pleurochrysis_carterae.AAC.1
MVCARALRGMRVSNVRACARTCYGRGNRREYRDASWPLCGYWRRVSGWNGSRWGVYAEHAAWTWPPASGLTA